MGLNKILVRRIGMSLCGVIICAIAVGFFKRALFGVDPFQCLCNAFWIMVIRSAFSNRFAYLSWFIYPIVIAYPLVNLRVWDDQDRKTGWILLSYVGFTAVMIAFVW